MTAVEKVVQLCERPDMGIERLNARSARLGEFDIIVLAGWLHMLATGTDCERAARRPNIAAAAREALREVAARFYEAAANDSSTRYLMAEVRRMVG